jgi:hypothetical protein
MGKLTRNLEEQIKLHEQPLHQDWSRAAETLQVRIEADFSIWGAQGELRTGGSYEGILFGFAQQMINENCVISVIPRLKIVYVCVCNYTFINVPANFSKSK